MTPRSPPRCPAASRSATAGSALRAGTASTSASSTRTAPYTSPTSWPKPSLRAPSCSSSRPRAAPSYSDRSTTRGAPREAAAGRLVGPPRHQHGLPAGRAGGGHLLRARADVRTSVSRAPPRHRDRGARAVHHWSDLRRRLIVGAGPAARNPRRVHAARPVVTARHGGRGVGRPVRGPVLATRSSVAAGPGALVRAQRAHVHAAAVLAPRDVRARSGLGQVPEGGG